MLTTETLEQGVKYVQSCEWRRSGVFIVKFEHFAPFSSVFMVNSEQVNASWDVPFGGYLCPRI